MLILTRKVGEMIRIGDDVTVRVLAVRGGQVSLGFTAPSDVRIFREEVLREDPPVPACEPAMRSREEPHPLRTAPAKLYARPPRARRVASRSA